VAGVGNGVDDPLEGDTLPKGEKRLGLTRSVPLPRQLPALLYVYYCNCSGVRSQNGKTGLTKDLGYGDISETKLLLQEASKLLEAYSRDILNSEYLNSSSVRLTWYQ